MLNDRGQWVFHKAVIDGEYLEVDGVNIWDHPWVNTHQYIDVKDPIYGQAHVMTVSNISLPDRTIVFAAGEFSNLIWGIYLPQQP